MESALKESFDMQCHSAFDANTKKKKLLENITQV